MSPRVRAVLGVTAEVVGTVAVALAVILIAIALAEWTTR
jgi:hypothetical protein